MAGISITDVRRAMAEAAFSPSSRSSSSAVSEGNGGRNFLDHLSESLKEVNELNKSADTMAKDVAMGKSENLHETMLALTQAELSFNLMVQVRNKVLEAYQEVMRMPV